MRVVALAIAGTFGVALFLLVSRLDQEQRSAWLAVTSPFLIGLLAAFYFTERAYAHLSEKGQAFPFGALVRGSLAGPEYFTKEGWRCRRLAQLSLLAGFVGSCILMIARD